ncbi:MAG: TlpA family protein disulfide reductase [SAR324 cluster bacterium]|nr:TlpA family protein disulfide reductase [SAR324 cluster bacterium]
MKTLIRELLATGLLCCWSLVAFANSSPILPEEKPFEIDFPDSARVAQEFEIEGLTGERVVLSEFLGKVVLINFWTTWCVPCVKEMPELEELAKSMNPQHFVILTVNVREPLSRVEKFLQKRDFSLLKFGMDLDGKAYKKYGVRQFPSTFIVDRDGYFAGRIRGSRAWTSSQSIRFFQKLVQDS